LNVSVLLNAEPVPH